MKNDAEKIWIIGRKTIAGHVGYMHTSGLVFGRLAAELLTEEDAVKILAENPANDFTVEVWKERKYTKHHGQ